MAELFYDTNFWVLLSFLIFCVVAFKYGKNAVLDSLDSKINAIKMELDSAEKLRVDAQELLAEYERKHKDAISEAANIIAQAQQNADAIKEKAEADLAKTMQRREAQLQENLSRIEQNARQEIQAYTAKIAVNAARDVLSDNMNAKADKIILSNTLDNLPKTLN